MNQERLLQILVSPVMTEKTSYMAADNKYAFNVISTATKVEIKHAVEKMFDVKVSSVNVLNRKGKRKMRGAIRGVQKSIRRAFVTLESGHSISFADK